MIHSHQLKVSKTAHYASIGEPGPGIRYCWIACHGYGQLARFFIRKFAAIAGPDTLILAPEGFSRFYWDGFTGKVVATWMTREDRLVEIEDYSNYLSQLYEMYIPQLAPDVRIILFGFSQGCATQVRWMCGRHPRFDHLVLWGGLLPEDIDYSPHHAYLQQGQCHLVYGVEDIYLTAERIQQQTDLQEKYRLPFNLHTFPGGHEVDRNALEALKDRLV